MRRARPFFLLFLVPMLVSCNSVHATSDPVVGRWQTKQSGALLVLDFKKDGTIEVNLPAPEKGANAAVIARFKKLTSATMKWQKESDYYKISTALPEKTRWSFVRVQGNELIPLDADLKPNPKAAKFNRL
jgi:hypothetical protein